MEKFVLNYRGFHPSDFTRSYLEARMWELQDEAPFGAALKASFSRKNEVFNGVIKIHSAAGSFFASASGRKVNEVTKKLMDQIRKQLGRWKSYRFQRESLKDLPVKDTNAVDTNIGA